MISVLTFYQNFLNFWQIAAPGCQVKIVNGSQNMLKFKISTTGHPGVIPWLQLGKNLDNVDTN